jgi:uncharacterized damage-inducible protein DinB
MTGKEFLLDQLTMSYDENGWFVALKNALRNLTAEQAAWKPEALDNSIWGIVAHLNFYNERHLQRFNGEELPPSNLENAATFSTRENRQTFAGGEAASEEAWRAETERFDSIMSGWRDAIEAAADEKLMRNVSAENPSPWWEVISNISAHNAHHGGQIVVMRKLQGSWDASKGVS